jgi:dTDP-4-amino-4,6-dideoxygalactose transaminase
VAGFNYRLTEFQGAIGVVQMARLGGALRHRADVANSYTRELSGLGGVQLPTVPPGAEPAWQSYVLRVPANVRNALRSRLFARGVETSLGTWSASTQPRYRGYADPLPPRSIEAFEGTLALPLHEGIGPAEVSEVTQAVAACLAELQGCILA